MSLELLQELSPEYAQYLVEGMHKLMSAAAEQRRYDDVSILSGALSALKAHENVTEVGYRNSEVKTEEPEPPEPPEGMEDYVTLLVHRIFSENSQVTSADLLSHVEELLRQDNPDCLSCKTKYARPYWKYCTAKSTQKLLEEGYITKLSRYNYQRNTEHEVLGEYPDDTND